MLEERPHVQAEDVLAAGLDHVLDRLEDARADRPVRDDEGLRVDDPALEAVRVGRDERGRIGIGRAAVSPCSVVQLALGQQRRRLTRLSAGYSRAPSSGARSATSSPWKATAATSAGSGLSARKSVTKRPRRSSERLGARRRAARAAAGGAARRPVPARRRAARRGCSTSRGSSTGAPALRPHCGAPSASAACCRSAASRRGQMEAEADDDDEAGDHRRRPSTSSSRPRALPAGAGESTIRPACQMTPRKATLTSTISSATQT